MFFLVVYPCAVLYAPLPPPSPLTRSRSKLFAMCLSTIESLTEAMGVLRETWYGMKNDGARSKSILREHPFIQGPPGSRIVLPDFDAPIDLEDRYAQRLTAYLQVNVKYPYLKRSSFCSFKLFLFFFCFFLRKWKIIHYSLVSLSLFLFSKTNFNRQLTIFRFLRAVATSFTLRATIHASCGSIMS